ncbi:MULTISPECIES: DUF397 domain-containing protein [unclassified Streptomyces]|uniref:DUF397 domain-containing protein n=1 Tax=unclassified Streptomyces TaxID=2593676 RepID=UPI00278BFFE6|nr:MULTISPECIES: DUF397 domain-containing protein [unclassified Streptomyces]
MPEFQFRKSSYSNIQAECLEVARNIPRTVAVRDSKDADGAIVRLTPASWTRFIDTLR